MKTHQSCSLPVSTPIRLALAAATTLLLAAGPGRTHAQNLYVSSVTTSNVGEYNATTGADISNPLLTSDPNAIGMALSGNNLHVANFNDNTVTAYDATTSAAASGFTTISPGSSPWDVLASGSLLYVSTFGDGAVSAYNAATGTAAPGFTTITGMSQATGETIVGTTLYVSNQGTDTIATYDANTGTLIDAAFLSGFAHANFLTSTANTLYVPDDRNHQVSAFDATTGAALPGFTTITDLTDPEGVKVFGNDLFVANFDRGTVSEYDATTGALINATFVNDLGGQFGLAVSGVPKPSTWVAMFVGSGLLAMCRAARRGAGRPSA